MSVREKVKNLDVHGCVCDPETASCCTQITLLRNAMHVPLNDDMERNKNIPESVRKELSQRQRVAEVLLHKMLQSSGLDQVDTQVLAQGAREVSESFRNKLSEVNDMMELISESDLTHPKDKTTTSNNHNTTWLKTAQRTVTWASESAIDLLGRFFLAAKRVGLEGLDLLCNQPLTIAAIVGAFVLARSMLREYTATRVQRYILENQLQGRLREREFLSILREILWDFASGARFKAAWDTIATNLGWIFAQLKSIPVLGWIMESLSHLIGVWLGETFQMWMEKITTFTSDLYNRLLYFLVDGSAVLRKLQSYTPPVTPPTMDVLLRYFRLWPPPYGRRPRNEEQIIYFYRGGKGDEATYIQMAQRRLPSLVIRPLFASSHQPSSPPPPSSDDGRNKLIFWWMTEVEQKEAHLQNMPWSSCDLHVVPVIQRFGPPLPSRLQLKWKPNNVPSVWGCNKRFALQTHLEIFVDALENANEWKRIQDIAQHYYQSNIRALISRPESEEEVQDALETIWIEQAERRPAPIFSDVHRDQAFKKRIEQWKIRPEDQDLVHLARNYINPLPQARTYFLWRLASSSIQSLFDQNGSLLLSDRIFGEPTIPARVAICTLVRLKPGTLVLYQPHPISKMRIQDALSDIQHMALPLLVQSGKRVSSFYLLDPDAIDQYVDFSYQEAQEWLSDSEAQWLRKDLDNDENRLHPGWSLVR